jgi:hypothetical protein
MFYLAVKRLSGAKGCFLLVKIAQNIVGHFELLQTKLPKL